MATFRGSRRDENDGEYSEKFPYGKPPRRSVPLCVIRPYTASDQPAVAQLLGDAAMETVWDYYLQAVLSTLTPQLCFGAFAFGFLILGWPFYGCASLVPVPLVLLYGAMWMAHFFKRMELQEESATLVNGYMTQPKTIFYVAEIYDNVLSDALSAHVNTSKKFEYDFTTRKALGSEDLTKAFEFRIVVGCIGVAKSDIKDDRAWIKRLTVHRYYRRRGVAQHLVEEAVKFCEESDYSAVDMLATDCHYQARSLFHKLEFNSTMGYKGLLGFTLHRYLFSLKLQKKEEQNTVEEATLIDY